MMQTNRPLYLILGPSGSGKSTIVKGVCEMMRVSQVMSCTTRPPRGDEDDHMFISDDEFDEAVANRRFAATTIYNGYRYGALWTEVLNGDLYIIDPAGAASLDRDRIPRPIYHVYVDASRDIRAQRMLTRGDTEEAVERRLEYDKNAFARNNRPSSDVMYYIENDWEIAEAVEELVGIICANWPTEETT